MEFSNGVDRAKAPATVLAIGTANPPTCFPQEEYPDYYFRVTKTEHLTDLKEKFKGFCKNSMISKRYLYMNEKVLEENPFILDRSNPSLDQRLDIEVKEVPKLAAEAAEKAIAEWGRPKSLITHLVLHSTQGVEMPGGDYELVQLLGLDLSVNRTMLYQLGCYGGGTVIRVAKDIAENNVGARVLVVCSELSVNAFHPPMEGQLGMLVGHAVFGNGAAALIMGSDPDIPIERPLFQIISAGQTIVPDSRHGVGGRYGKDGFIYYVAKELCDIVAANAGRCVEKACKPLGLGNADWNSFFWMIHPGGPKILKAVEKSFDLETGKLRASFHALSEYGNMLSSSLLFIMDEMRKNSTAEGSATTGEGLKWGIAMAFGPGVTIETLVLRSIPLVGH